MQSAESQQPKEVAVPLKWEYSTNKVEASSLAVKLGELTNDGWEVFSITHVETVFDQQAADNRPHLIVEKFQVTAKRRMK